MRIEFKSIDEATAPSRTVRPRRGGDARLWAAIMALANGHGRISDHRQSPWASVTFSGTRHELLLEFVGTDAIIGGERLIETLPDHEFAIPRQLVADAAIASVDHVMIPEPAMSVRCELLLIDDA